MLRLIDATRVPAQPWRNSGGRTRELLAWPTADDWQLRISVADIESDGPFSAFPGVERWFAVIDGGGVELRFTDRALQLKPGDAPVRFDGGTPPEGRCMGGPTRDLNLMHRGGRGVMRAVTPGVAWQEPFAQRGLLTAMHGRFDGAGASHQLAALTLLWWHDAPPEALRFVPTQLSSPHQPIGWWLGFAPDQNIAV